MWEGQLSTDSQLLFGKMHMLMQRRWFDQYPKRMQKVNNHWSLWGKNSKRYRYPKLNYHQQQNNSKIQKIQYEAILFMTPVKMVKSALNNNVKLKAKRLPIKSAENPKIVLPQANQQLTFHLKQGTCSQIDS